MPRGDRTGPEGRGQQTGRRMGYCVGNNHPGFENNSGNFGGGRGFGRGMGRGAGNAFRNGGGYGQRFDERVSNVSEKTLLENDVKILKEQLENMEKQLSEINKKD
ncbi:MAG: DUF5320 domain-containing protein [Bacteroidota bacterium]|nr:DUF5320 domain-containing protein [Bacteroidota bacterium]